MDGAQMIADEQEVVVVNLGGKSAKATPEMVSASITRPWPLHSDNGFLQLQRSNPQLIVGISRGVILGVRAITGMSQVGNKVHFTVGSAPSEYEPNPEGKTHAPTKMNWIRGEAWPIKTAPLSSLIAALAGAAPVLPYHSIGGYHLKLKKGVLHVSAPAGTQVIVHYGN